MDLFKTESGIKLNKHKRTVGMAVVPVSLPERVYIPLPSDGEYSCRPLVAPNDLVKMGTLIADSDNVRLAPVHSSVSGRVEAIESRPSAGGSDCLHIVIRTDGRQDHEEGLALPKAEDRESLLKAARASGVTEDGEECISIAESLNFPEGSADTLIVNAYETEPYLTSDHMTVLAHAGEIAAGCRTLMNCLGIAKTIIALEENKKDAAALLKSCTAEDRISIVRLAASYPHGTPRGLCREAAGKELPSGAAPIEAGIALIGVSALLKLQQYLDTGMPLITRSFTVEGNAITKAMNIEAPIGTELPEILSFCGGIKKGMSLGKLILGGPLTGKTLPGVDLAIGKGFSGLICFDEKYSITGRETACINCGRCISVCPEGLMPMRIAKAWEHRRFERLKELDIFRCTGCGCCSYICPARKPLSFEIAQAKASQEMQEGGAQ